jgi:transposase
MDCDAKQQAETIDQQAKQIDQMAQTIEEQAERIKQLKHDLAQLRRYYFGPRRERYVGDDAGQEMLFELLAAAAAAAEPEGDGDETGAQPTDEEPSDKKKGHGRRKLPAGLPRKVILHILEGDDLLCSCCNEPRTKISEEVSEQLEFVPASLFVIQHIRHIYACANEHCIESSVATAPKPAQPIDKGLPGSGLLAHVVTSKLADHLPLNRQEDILARSGIHLRRSTLCGWMAQCAVLAMPLYALLLRRVLRSHIVGVDDTTVSVRDTSLDRTRQAYFWEYYGDDSHPYVCFEFSTTRARAGPEKILANFTGILQGDAYWEDIKTALPELENFAGCMSHARRYFEESLDKAPNCDVHAALAYIQRLYDVEDEARTMTAEERLALRQQKSVPILEAFRKWLDAQKLAVIPTNPLAAAITYATNQWESLLVYTTDGNVPIDNNAVERMMRHPVLGRGNWLFLGSDNGGHTAAVLYSLVITCKRLRIDPWAYLEDVFRRLPSANALELRQLLPDRWIKQHPQHRLVHREKEAEAAARRKRTRRAQRRRQLAEAVTT